MSASERFKSINQSLFADIRSATKVKYKVADNYSTLLAKIAGV